MKAKFNVSKDDLYKLYIINNKTVAEISNLFEVSTATINRFLKLYDLKKDDALRRQKISLTKQSKSIEEKELYSKHISEARKGKGIGSTPWNKGKHTGNNWLGKCQSEETKAKISATKNSKSIEEKQAIELKRKLSRGKIIPWNKGLTYTMDPDTIRHAKEKEIATKKLNGTFQKSNLEEDFYNKLLGYFREEDIIRQYFNIEKYPFNCDFYIKPLDLYIELNGNWTHGFRPFAETDEFCREQLARWQEKAKTSDYYKNAIYTWTDLDVRKQSMAVQNSLMYLAIYTQEDMTEFFNILDESLEAEV